MSRVAWRTRVVLVAAILSVVFLAAVSPPLRAQQTQDVVYLKDGSVIRGVIVEQVPGVSILIRTRDGNSFRYAMDRIARMTKEGASGGGSAAVQSQKSPGTAFLLSFLIVGGGQAYNGQWPKAGIMFGGAVVGATLFVGYASDCWNWDESCGTAYAGLGLLAGTAVWSMIDAPISASAINRRIAVAGRRLELGPRINSDVGLHLSPEQRAALAAKSVRVGPRVGVSLVRLSL